MNKNFFKLFFILLALFPSFVWAITREVSVTEAYYRNYSHFAGNVNVYHYENTGYHMFFVDKEPTKNWEHDCEYVFVTKTVEIPEDPVSTYLPAHRPYLNLDFQPYSITVSDSVAAVDVKNSVVTPDLMNAAGKTYAVILSGGMNKNSNYQRYWNDCSFIYQTLRRRFHIPKDHISVLMSDGTDPAVDMRTTGGYFISSPLDLDADGVADINMAATKANLTSELNRLSQVMTAEDKLFFYVIDHGGTDDNNGTSYIWLWNSQKIYDYELATLLNQFNVSSMSIVLGQCYGGGFVDNLSASNRVITTACNYNQQSYASFNGLFDEFVYHWTTAVNERDIFGTSVTSDANDDGWVTMLEAYNYAVSHDVWPEIPQISTASIRNTLALNDEPFTYVLMLRDNEEDVGDQPNTTTTLYYTSPDIWARNTNDGFDYPYTERIVIGDSDAPSFYTYYRITNIGEKDYTSNDMFVHPFWAEAAFGFNIGDWLGQNYNSYACGGAFEPFRVGVTIPAGQSVIVMKNYNVPNSVCERLEDSPENVFHICYMACLTNSMITYIPLPPDPEIPSMVDILGHRNIAQTNILFATPEEAAQGLSMIARNVFDTDREYSIEVLPVKDMPTNIRKTEIGLRLSENLYEAWRQNGASAEKMASYSSAPRMLYAQGFGSKVGDLRMKKGQEERILCTCNIIADEDVSEETTYAYDIVMRDKVTRRIIDGERFVIRQQPRKAILPEIAKEATELGYVLRAQHVDEDATYTWFDETGSKVGEGEEVTVVPSQKTRKYRLQVRAKEDGAVNYAETAVDSYFTIKTVSPNPFTTQLTVKLNAVAGSNTFVRLTPVSGSGASEDYRIKSGEEEVTIYTSGYSKGVYVLSLLNNGKVLDSRQVVCE